MKYVSGVYIPVWWIRIQKRKANRLVKKECSDYVVLDEDLSVGLCVPFIPQYDQTVFRLYVKWRNVPLTLNMALMSVAV